MTQETVETFDVGIFDHMDKNDLPLAEFYEARLKIAEAYDREDFFAYHCAEHHLTPGGMTPSPAVFLSAVAQRTRRLRFGPLIFTLPLHHPLRIAEEICMLDQLSGGRLELGFGRGSNLVEVGYFGGDPKAAAARYDDMFVVLTKALQSGVFNVPVGGEMRELPMPIQPHQRPFPPLWYGVHSAESAEKAARRGSSTVSLDSADETRVFSDRYRAVWNSLHPSAATMPRLGISRFIVVADSDEEAVRLARPAYTRWYDNFTYTSRLHGYTVPSRSADFDVMQKSGKAVAGAPSTVARFVREQMKLSGANYFVGQFAFGDLPLEATLKSIQLFSRVVRPIVQSRASIPAAPAAYALNA